MTGGVRTEISIDELTRQLIDLGVERGGVLLVHTSFRAVRPVENGPEGLVEALRRAVGQDGTVVMPSWPGSRDDVFDARRSPCAGDLGVTAQVFWRMAGVQRSEHPQAFAALGSAATEVLRDPLPLPPHIPESPVGRVHEADGQVLLLGVNHDADTTIHLAELLGGAPYRVPKYCTVLHNGSKTRVEYGENDHCCRRFVLVDDWLRSAQLQSEGPVGHTRSRLAKSRAVVSTVLDRVRTDPLVFLHPAGARCAACDEARASIEAAP